jgi:XTP/dITP diphosphohydrolase
VSTRVLLATRSAGKIRELRALFAAQGRAFEVVGLDDAGIDRSPEEDTLEAANTFEENALAKARYFHRRSGLATVADDSGLCVDALGGAPGVHSKRWSGRSDLDGQPLDNANNALLLLRLSGASTRRAQYVCAAAFCDASREFVERGESAGVITTQPIGGGGFGYDPYFLSDELQRTFADVSLEEKAAVSHRARAFRKLVARLMSNA